MVIISVAGKEYISMDEYNQLSRQLSQMEWRLKAMENIQELLRQKDLEVVKCISTIKHYRMALHRSELKLLDVMQLVTRVPEAKDRFGKEETRDFKDVSDQNKGFCLPCVDVSGKLVQELDGMKVASDIIDYSTTLTQSTTLSRASTKSTCEDSNCNTTLSAGDSILKATKHQQSAEMLAINSHQFWHDSGTLRMDDACGQDNIAKDEGKKEIISRLMCSNLKSNRQRDNQRPVFHLPHGSSFSKDLLNKLMQQNARLKKALKDVLSCSGTNVEHYLDREELTDTVTQLRQQLAKSTQQTTDLQKKLKISEEMKQTRNCYCQILTESVKHN